MTDPETKAKLDEMSAFFKRMSENLKPADDGGINWEYLECAIAKQIREVYGTDRFRLITDREKRTIDVKFLPQEEEYVVDFTVTKEEPNGDD